MKWPILLVLVMAAPLSASGPGRSYPWTIDTAGGEARGAIDAGRPGILLGGSSAARLFKGWRLLHGLPLGPNNLEEACCDPPVTAGEAADHWRDARQALVPSAPEIAGAIDPSVSVGEFETRPNCLTDAFDAATATLRARVTSEGAASPWVLAWLGGQDAVFASCTGTRAAMPPLPDGAPGWLRADRAYQLAAQSLYVGDVTDAVTRFRAIGRDRASPYAPRSEYLIARVLLRAALDSGTPAAVKGAERALASVRDRPGYGRESAAGLAKMLAVYRRPAAAQAQLGGALLARALPATAASDFKDWRLASRLPGTRPEALDWIDAMQGLARRASHANELGEPVDADPVAALDRAHQRWRKSGDVAWLLAALLNTPPGDARAPALVAAAAKVPAGHAGYLTAQFHRWRLDTGDPATARAALDALIARPDLSVTDRNLFKGLRLRVADGLADFAWAARRERICRAASGPCEPPELYDGGQSGDFPAGERRGIGPDAWLVIDRMPIAMRVALLDQPGWTTEQELDLALTTWARAVQRGDAETVDVLSARLARLLPQLGAEFARIPIEPAGARRRFAEFLVLAKVPGIRADWPDYVRPTGTVDEFQYRWPNWFVTTRPDPRGAPPPAKDYAEGETDPLCRERCGSAAVATRLPPFVAGAATIAASDRAYLIAGVGPDAPPPAGAVSVWEEMLAFARANPADARVPEALYWLVRVSRYGESWNRSGKRAFDLLHQRYPDSPWTKRTPYWFD